METISISAARKLSKVRSTRGKRRKPKQQLTGAEQIAAFYLQALYPERQVIYELGRIHLRNTTYTPDLVVLGPLLHRVYVEVKESRKAGKWQGFRIRETMVKLCWLKEKVEAWGHRVVLLTVEKGRVVEEKEIE